MRGSNVELAAWIDVSTPAVIARAERRVRLWRRASPTSRRRGTVGGGAADACASWAPATGTSEASETAARTAMVAGASLVSDTGRSFGMRPGGADRRERTPAGRDGVDRTTAWFSCPVHVGRALTNPLHGAKTR